MVRRRNREKLPMLCLPTGDVMNGPRVTELMTGDGCRMTVTGEPRMICSASGYRLETAEWLPGRVAGRGGGGIAR